jgi:hypothetical protein
MIKNLFIALSPMEPLIEKQDTIPHEMRFAFMLSRAGDGPMGRGDLLGGILTK